MSTQRGDAVRQAVGRWRERFPEIDEVLNHDPYANHALKLIEDMLVRADVAMQDEGLDDDQRRRVATAALYGSVDVEKAHRDMADRQRQLEYLQNLGSRQMINPRDVLGPRKD